jgi:hypothetical protein
LPWVAPGVVPGSGWRNGVWPGLFRGPGRAPGRLAPGLHRAFASGARMGSHMAIVSVGIPIKRSVAVRGNGAPPRSSLCVANVVCAQCRPCLGPVASGWAWRWRSSTVTAELRAEQYRPGSDDRLSLHGSVSRTRRLESRAYRCRPPHQWARGHARWRAGNLDFAACFSRGCPGGQFSSGS